MWQPCHVMLQMSSNVVLFTVQPAESQRLNQSLNRCTALTEMKGIDGKTMVITSATVGVGCFKNYLRWKNERWTDGQFDCCLAVSLETDFSYLGDIAGSEKCWNEIKASNASVEVLGRCLYVNALWHHPYIESTDSLMAEKMLILKRLL